MHETDMTKALMMTVRDWWEAQPERPAVSRVHLTVGKFTCVEPVSLQFAFEVQTRGTFLDGAELVIAETPLVAFCHPCQQTYAPEIGVQYACPTCGTPMSDIRSGRELKVDRIEYAVVADQLVDPTDLRPHPQPFSPGRRGPDSKSLFPRERDLG
jgi:hydrogenase nickel incorporation protein HypA/HybF